MNNHFLLNSLISVVWLEIWSNSEVIFNDSFLWLLQILWFILDSEANVKGICFYVLLGFSKAAHAIIKVSKISNCHLDYFPYTVSVILWNPRNLSFNTYSYRREWTFHEVFLYPQSKLRIFLWSFQVKKKWRFSFICKLYKYMLYICTSVLDTDTHSRISRDAHPKL